MNDRVIVYTFIGMNEPFKYKCIKSFEITGKGEIFTKGLMYRKGINNCLINNLGVNTIVFNNTLFEFDEYFNEKNKL